MWGAFKFTALEAEAIRPLVEHSPFLSWLYPVLGIRGTPGVLAPDHPIGGFLMKDVLLLGAALFTAAEALDAAAMKRSTAAADTRLLRFYQQLGFRLTHIERDVFTPSAGYPADLRVDGIRMLDRVWAALEVP